MNRPDLSMYSMFHVFMPSFTFSAWRLGNESLFNTAPLAFFAKEVSILTIREYSVVLLALVPPRFVALEW